jgi:hypothetical protein
MTELNKRNLTDPKYIRDIYLENMKKQFLRILLMGEPGTGKSRLSRTARKPVHVDSFDKNGSIHLYDLVEAGEMIVDTSYEGDDPYNPTKHELWVEVFKERLRTHYFEQFGTYVLDSFTGLSAAIMNRLTKGRTEGGPVYTKDYAPQKNWLELHMKQFMFLPCDVIVTGHIAGFKDDLDNEGSVKWRFCAPGRSVSEIPALFDEKWVMVQKDVGRNRDPEFQILTKPVNDYLASTRIGSGVFSTFETPDIKHLLKKVGWNTDDKPKLFFDNMNNSTNGEVKNGKKPQTTQNR